jgi:hypothetical protein
MWRSSIQLLSKQAKGVVLLRDRMCVAISVGGVHKSPSSATGILACELFWNEALDQKLQQQPHKTAYDYKQHTPIKQQQTISAVTAMLLLLPWRSLSKHGRMLHTLTPCQQQALHQPRAWSQQRLPCEIGRRIP